MATRVEVVRAFWLAGSVQAVGAVLTVADGVAAELTSAGKVRSAPPVVSDPPSRPARRARPAPLPEPEPQTLTPET